MSRVQESIQKNERQLILDRQSLAHMENSSWRHTWTISIALLKIQEPSHFKRTIRRLKAGIDKLEEIQRHSSSLESRCLKARDTKTSSNPKSAPRSPFRPLQPPLPCAATRGAAITIARGDLEFSIAGGKA